jgi:hypothetical protein
MSHTWGQKPAKIYTHGRFKRINVNTKATRNICSCGVPQLSGHFELTLQDCEIGSSFTKGRGATLRALVRAGARQAKELLGWIPSSKPKYNTLPKHFPRRACRLSKASRNFCICGVPPPSEHFGTTLEVCGSRQRLQSEACCAPAFRSSPRPSGGKAALRTHTARLRRLAAS